MRIAFRGNFRPRTALGEPFSTESHLSATMEILGHEVVRIQEDEVPWSGVLSFCHEADLFFWVCTWHDDFDGGYNLIESLRDRGIPTVSFTLDLFVGLDREKYLDSDPFWRTDYVFSADGGHPEVWAAKGINHRWMPPGVFEPECYIAEPVPELVQDLVFVGSYGYHAQWPHRKILIDFLKTTYGTHFTHYDHGSGMRGHRLNQLYASAAIVIGDSCCPGFRQTRYWSDRIPETLGRGGVLLHPWIEGMEEQWGEQGKYLTYYDYGSWDALMFNIDSLLKWSTAREERRKAGHEWVKANHTYTRRIQQMLTIIGKGTP